MEEIHPKEFQNLVCLRHPDDGDFFALLDDIERGILIHFDVDLNYIVIHQTIVPHQGGEHGDWGEGVQSQVSLALAHLKILLRSP